MNIEIISRIIPKNGQNFPVLEDKYIHGGFHVVTSFSEVSMESRKEGMLICLQGDNKYYKLVGGLEDGYWTEVILPTQDTNTFYYEEVIPPTSTTNVEVLTHFDVDFTDSSSNNLSFFNGYPGGSVTDVAISSDQSKFGGGSAYMNGIGQYLTAPIDGKISLTDKEFCIEGWFYPTNLSGRNILFSMGSDSLTDHSIEIMYFATPEFIINGRDSSSTYFQAYTGDPGLVQDSWNHVALTRDSSGTIAIYVNGDSKTITGYATGVGYSGSAINVVDFSTDPNANVWVGCRPGDVEGLQGYVDEFRITSGSTVYSGNFTPPTQPFTIPIVNDGYIDSLNPFTTETGKVYSLGISVTVASNESDMVANFIYKMVCRDQSGVIVIDSINEVAAYDPESYFTVNFTTTGLDQVLNIQLINASSEEVTVKATVLKENEVSRT